MKKRYYVTELSELKCPKCIEVIANNLQKIDFIKEVEINFDEKYIDIEAGYELNKNEIDLVIKTVVAISHCDVHELSKENSDLHVVENFTFKDVDCPNCALKIERALNSDNEIISASVNFINKKITIKHRSDIQVFDKVNKIVNTIGHGATIIDENVEEHHNHCDGTCHDHSSGQSKQKNMKWLRSTIFIAGLVIYAIAIILHFFSKFEYTMIIFIVSYFMISYNLLIAMFKSIFHGDIFNEKLLMVVATIGALIIQEPIEAILVILLFKVGEKLESRAVDRSTREIKSLIDLKVDIVNMEDGTKVDIKNVKIGDKIIVKVGEKIPLDGIIIEGQTNLDTKVLTGESLPKHVDQGEEVLSGCINLTQVIKVEVRKLEADSTANRVIKLIEEASNKKSKAENFIGKFARIYTPIVMILSVIILIIQKFILNYEWSFSLNTAFVFLVTSCPCALVISIPLSFFGGIGRSSKDGILVRGGNYLEALAKSNYVVFDKTGTITKGNFKVTEVKIFNKMSQDEFIKIVAHVESYSNHPIAQSINDYYGKEVDNNFITNVEEIPGYGVKAYYYNDLVVIGNERLMQKEAIKYHAINEAGTIVYVAINNIYCGYLLIQDEIKANAKMTITALKQMDIKTCMLTGDNFKIAEHVSKNVGIDEFHAELLPDQKLSLLENIIENQDLKHNVAYIGDGINDAPSLKLSDVGIAMGAMGSDIAKESADIIIVNDDIAKVVTAVKISKMTRKVVIQNICLSLGIKLAIMIIVSFGLLGQYQSLGMLLGVFADVGVSLIAILNAMRIINKKHF